MLFPEFLYQLNARDQQVTWLEPLFTQINPAAALQAAWSELVYQVPNDRVLVLTHVFASANPGGAQGVTDLAIFARVPLSSPAYRLLFFSETIVAGLTRATRWQGELLLPPGWQIAISATFDAAAVANAVSADVAGVLIPTGTIQRL